MSAARGAILARIVRVGLCGVLGVLGVGACSSSGKPYVAPSGPSIATLHIKSGNLFYKPNKLTAPAGIVTIDLTNSESGSHTLVLSGPGGRVPSFKLSVTGQGDSDAKKVALSPGTYEFWCTIPGHRAAGMDGHIVVK